MQFRTNLINIALLGTEKKQVNVSELPEALQATVEKITLEEPDNETKFLKTAAIALNYYRAGVQPEEIPFELDEAPKEQLNYCSKETIKVLKETLDYKYPTLTWFWCNRCRERNLIVQPHLLPGLFEWGISTKKHWSGLFRSVIGHRGIWLSKFSDEWSFVKGEEEMTDWDTASLRQRIAYLRRVRTENAAEAINSIKLVWKEENAASRVELMETLAIGISCADEEFLTQQLNDRSQKVKETAWQLLKLIPTSQIILSYQKVLDESFLISHSKKLGLINKTTIAVKLQISNAEVLKTGIQTLSNNKKISDNDYILMQLVSEVPPAFWESKLGGNVAEVVRWFVSKDELTGFQASLCQAVLKYQNKSWSKEILTQFPSPPVQLLQILDEDDRGPYAEKLLKDDVNEVVNALRFEEAKEWSIRLTRQLFAIMAENPSFYSKNYFETVSIYLPSSIVNELGSFAPADEWKRNYWLKTSQEIKELITLKEKIKNIF
jgi:hypothetical protein